MKENELLKTKNNDLNKQLEEVQKENSDINEKNLSLMQKIATLKTQVHGAVEVTKNVMEIEGE